MTKARRYFGKALAGFLFLFATGLKAAPAQVVIIRHAEKPEVGSHLSTKGWQRAHALVGFFENNPAVTQFGRPVVLYAMSPKSEDGSVRAIETVTPLADRLGMKIDEDFRKKELHALVKEIMRERSYEGRMVVICWEHKIIPELVAKFGWKHAPDTWHGSVFDRAWILNFKGDRVISFRDVPQRLLPGDSPR